MVSSGVVALALAAFVQVACSSYIHAPCSYPVHPEPCSHPVVKYEETCCPGAVIEKKQVTHKPVTETYTYQVPVYSKKCHQKHSGVDKQVFPKSYESAPVCQTQETVVKVPTTDVEEHNQPLCKRTCTTSSYIIQIPITETTCTNSPLCKKTLRSQDNLLTTVSKKTTCAKQQCTQNTVVEKPVYDTVCQDYQQSINKVGTKTVLKPEVNKYCVQLPPYRCTKPVYEHAAPVTHAYTSAHASDYAYAHDGSVIDNYSAGVFDSGCVDSSVHGVHDSWNVGSAAAYSHAPVYGSSPCYQSAAPCNCAY